MNWIKNFLAKFFVLLIVTLLWDASPTPTVTGYKVYYEDKILPVQVVDVGNVLTYKIDVPAGRHWYFRVTAYDAAGNESDFSNEASTVPDKPTLDYGIQ